MLSTLQFSKTEFSIYWKEYFPFSLTFHDHAKNGYRRLKKLRSTYTEAHSFKALSPSYWPSKARPLLKASYFHKEPVLHQSFCFELYSLFSLLSVWVFSKKIDS